MKKAILASISILALLLYTSCGKDDGPDEPKEVEITGFSPTSGKVGTQVTITGKNFSSAKEENNVTFGSFKAPVMEAGPSELIVHVPTNAVTGKIKVIVGNSFATSATDFQVIQAQAPPSITGIDSSPACEGDGVTISGMNFGSNAQGVSVYINGSATTIYDHSATSITVQVPVGATSGLVEVKVGSLSATSENELQILPSPTLTSIGPMEGEWGTEITIDGTNFNAQGNQVIFQAKNGTLAGEILSESATQIVVTVPDGAKTGEIGIYNGECFVQSDAQFTVFPGRWTKIADFGGGTRRNAIAFVLNDHAYVGLGTDGTPNLQYNIWKYSPDLDQWTQEAEIFTGNPYLGAVSFVVDNVAYAGTGLFGSDPDPDFLKYDGQGAWQDITPEGTARWLGTAFSIGNKGYVSTGLDENGDELKDLWEYDPGTDVWTQKTALGGPERYNSVGFSIDGKGYIGAGYAPGEVYLKDFWEYDPANDEWTQKADIGGEQVPARAGASGFALGSKGYVGLGRNSVDDTFLKDFWEYDPNADIWTRIADFPGAPRMWAAAFVVNGKAYVGTGYDDENTLSDFWELDLGN